MKGGRIGSVLAVVVLAGLGVWPPSEDATLTPAVAWAERGACSEGPLSRPRPSCAPPPPESTGNPHQDCVARINQLRWTCQCLPPLERWKKAERCADAQAKRDSQRGIHASFNEGSCKPSGLAQNECPAWPSTEEVIDGCLQAMWDEGPGKRFSKHGHYLNMSNPRYERVACGFARTPEGKLWSVQNFR